MRTLPVLSLLFVIAAPVGAGAFERTGVSGSALCLFQADREVDWSAAFPLGAELPEEQALAAIRLSFAPWEVESCSDIAFVEGDRVDPVIDPGDGRTTLVFRPTNCAGVVPELDPCWEELDCGNRYNCWDGEARQIALTTTSYSTCDGEIRDSDIEFNGGGFRFTVADGPPCGDASSTDCVDTDLENTLVHEIGHVLGLDHSTVTDATMYARAETGETHKRDLAEDDRAALCSIYPAGAATVTCGAGECSSGGGSDSGCAAAGSGAAPAGLLAALAFLALRRRSGKAR